MTMLQLITNLYTSRVFDLRAAIYHETCRAQVHAPAHPPAEE